MTDRCSLLALPDCILSCVLQEWINLEALKTFDTACCNRLDRQQLHEVIRSDELNLYTQVLITNDIALLWMRGRRSACSRRIYIEDPHDDGDASLLYVSRFGSQVQILDVRDGSSPEFMAVTKELIRSCHNVKEIRYGNGSPGSRSILYHLLLHNKGLEKLQITSMLEGALSDDFADVHLPKLSSLSVLSLDCVSGILRAGNSITKMDLSNTIVTDFTELSALFPHLRTLSLARSRIRDADLGAVARGCATITSFDISECLNVTDEGIKHIVTNLTDLHSLNIDGCESLTSHSLSLIRKHSVQTLHTFFLSSMVYDGDMQQREYDHTALDILFSVCQNLRKLRWYDMSYDNPPYELSPSIHNLTTLVLGYDAVCDTNLIVVAEYCLKLQNLSIEFMDHVEIMDNIDKGLRSVAHGCPELQNLSIDFKSYHKMRYHPYIDGALALFKELKPNMLVTTHLLLPCFSFDATETRSRIRGFNVPEHLL